MFNTTHLSKYGIVGTSKIIETSNTSASVPTTTSITNPKTADKVVTYSLILVSLSISIVLVTLRIKKLNGAN